MPCKDKSADPCCEKEKVPLPAFRALVRKVDSYADFLVPDGGTDGQVLTASGDGFEWETLVIAWAAITGKPTEFPPSAHTHTISNVTGLQSALDGKADVVHGHSQSDISGLTSALNGKAPLVHTHAISQVSGLQAALDSKIAFDKTITPGGTTGAQTINKNAGTVNFAAAATTLVVTNSVVTATSLIFCFLRTADATAVLDSAVPAAGSFTIKMSVAPTAETSVGFIVI